MRGASWSSLPSVDPNTAGNTDTEGTYRKTPRDLYEDPWQWQHRNLIKAHRKNVTADEKPFENIPNGIELDELHQPRQLTAEQAQFPAEQLEELSADRKMAGEFKLIPLSEMLKELRTPAFYRDVLCEVNISFFLMFLATLISAARPEPVVAAFTSGILVFLLIDGFGHIQGALMNPVVTMAFVCTNRMSALKGLLFIGAQIAGGTAGVAAAKASMTPGGATNIGAVVPGVGVLDWQALVVEAVASYAIIFVTLGTLDEKRRTVMMPGFPIGLSIFIGIFAAGPVSGGGVNPCIVTALAINAGTFDKVWIYWAGDYVGGALAIVQYWFFTFDGAIFDTSKKGRAVQKKSITYTGKDTNSGVSGLALASLNSTLTMAPSISQSMTQLGLSGL